MGRFFAAAVVVCLVFTNNVFAQTGNASVGGFVQDPTQAFIPGVIVTATNTQTGVVTSAVTNESRTFTIPSLLPSVYNDVQLGANTTGRYNFTLEVGSVTDSVEVTAERTALIAETSPTVGQVLPEQKV